MGARRPTPNQNLGSGPGDKRARPLHAALRRSSSPSTRGRWGARGRAVSGGVGTAQGRAGRWPGRLPDGRVCQTQGCCEVRQRLDWTSRRPAARSGGGSGGYRGRNHGGGGGGGGGLLPASGPRGPGRTRGSHRAPALAEGHSASPPAAGVDTELPVHGACRTDLQFPETHRGKQGSRPARTTEHTLLKAVSHPRMNTRVPTVLCGHLWKIYKVYRVRHK